MMSNVYRGPLSTKKKKFRLSFSRFRNKTVMAGGRFPSFAARPPISPSLIVFSKRIQFLKDYLKRRRSFSLLLSRRSFFFSLLFSSSYHLRLATAFPPYIFFHLVHPNYSIPFNPFFYLRYPPSSKGSDHFWYRYQSIFNYASHRTLESRRSLRASYQGEEGEDDLFIHNVFRPIRKSLLGWFHPLSSDHFAFCDLYGTPSRPTPQNIHFERKQRRWLLKKRRPWIKTWPFRYNVRKKLSKKKWRRPKWFGRLLHWWGQVPECPLGYDYRKPRKPIVQARIIIQRTWSNFFFTLVSAAGRVLGSCSTGSLGFKGKQRTTPLAVSSAARRIAVVALRRGVRFLGLTLYSLGPRFHITSAIRALNSFKKHLRFRFLQEDVSVPHSLPKRPKRSRKVLKFFRGSHVSHYTTP